MSSPRHFCMYSYRHFLHTYPPLNWMFVVPFLPTCWSIASDFLSAACHGKKNSQPLDFCPHDLFSLKFTVLVWLFAHLVLRMQLFAIWSKKNYRPPIPPPMRFIRIDIDIRMRNIYVIVFLFPPFYSLFIYVNL